MLQHRLLLASLLTLAASVTPALAGDFTSPIDGPQLAPAYSTGPASYGPSLKTGHVSLIKQRTDTVTPNGRGGYHVSSFFDIFTDISLDGGATYRPAQFNDVAIDADYSLLAIDPDFIYRVTIPDIHCELNLPDFKPSLHFYNGDGQFIRKGISGTPGDFNPAHNFSSFFDIFVDISIDGAPPISSDAPLRFEAGNLPEPTALALLAPTAILLRRRK
jgi:hypothetical protein